VVFDRLTNQQVEQLAEMSQCLLDGLRGDLTRCDRLVVTPSIVAMRL